MAERMGKGTTECTMTDIKSQLGSLIPHTHISLMPRGNAAIDAALKIVSKRSDIRREVAIPDQGGWMTYDKLIRKNGLVVREIETIDGIFDLNIIDALSRDVAALLYANPAGYFARQDIDEIYRICKRNGCMVILDIAGCIGEAYLREAACADIYICSFGKWKPIEHGCGGFISSTGDLDIADDFDITNASGLSKKIVDVQSRLAKLHAKCVKIKSDLSSFEVIHPELEGINVIVAFEHDRHKEQIIRYCEENKLEYTLCPRYIRVLRPAISIEVKRQKT